MVINVMLGRHGSWAGRIEPVRTVRTAVAPQWNVASPTSSPVGAVGPELRGPVMQPASLYMDSAPRATSAISNPRVARQEETAHV
jgi:hypothetical protein